VTANYEYMLTLPFQPLSKFSLLVEQRSLDRLAAPRLRFLKMYNKPSSTRIGQKE